MKVFISYSTKDMHIVEEFRKLLEARGIEAYVAAKDVRPGDVLWEKLERNIRTSNCLVAILTKKGAVSGTLQNELGVAKANKIRIVALVEEGVDVTCVLSGIEYLKFDKDRLDVALSDAAAYLGKLKKEADSNLVGIVVLTALAIIALMSGSSK